MTRSTDAKLTSYFDGLQALLQRVATCHMGNIEAIATMLASVRACRARIFICGNGGSAATADHFACDLAKNAGGFQAVALPNSLAVLTAIANDVGYSAVFAEQLVALANPGDVLIVISASGNSPSILAVLRIARARRMWCVGLLGFDGGAARKMCDVAVVVPSRDYGQVEDAHLAICHAITAYFKEGQ